MAITVGAIYAAFPNFDSKDMIRLCNGNKNFNGRTVVSLANIAAFGDKDLSVFVAKKEGKTFTGLLGKNERAEINSAANVKDAGLAQGNDRTPSTAQVIPMDRSIFDVAAANKKKFV